VRPAALTDPEGRVTLRDMPTVPASPPAFGDLTAAETCHALLDAPERDLGWVGVALFGLSAALMVALLVAVVVLL
jgi:hypothetical protein